MVPGTVKHQKKKEKINGDQEGCRLNLKLSPDDVDISAGKGTSGIDKFGSEVRRVHMELGGNLLNSSRIKTQLLKRLQRVIVVDGATPLPKGSSFGGVERNGGSLKGGAAFVLFLRGAQLVLRSSVLAVLDFD